MTDYKNGVVHLVQCLAHDRQDRDPVVVTTAVYAHRTLPTVMVQDVKIYNPGSRTVRIDVEKGGISDWESAVSLTRVVEHGDGGQKYSVVTGMVEEGELQRVVAVASKKLASSVEVTKD